MGELTADGISEWYKDRTILITGGTGFMGKVLIEKLLRSCPDIRRIYILCRSKRGVAPQVRINEMTKLPVFQKLRNETPLALKKLYAIEGDVTSDNLGIKSELREVLKKEVSVVFNGAASLRLEAGMKMAVENNTLGTKRVLELCKDMGNLESFVHLSTAFCHCEYEVLEEMVYPCPENPENIIQMVQWLDEDSLKSLTPKLLKNHPNCYTYSKRLAECVVNEYAQSIPLAIVRPSIVVPAFREPIPGWVDSLNGPVGVAVGAAKGVIRSMLCDGENRAECIPVDVAINAIIAVSWVRGRTPISKEEPTLCYNLSIGDAITLTWGEILERGKKTSRNFPFENILWYPNGVITTNKFMHYFMVFFFQLIPAYLIDFLFFLARKKRFMVYVQNRISTGMHVLQYFTMRNWRFRIEKARGLLHLMNQRDQETFYLENVEYDLDEYVTKMMLGARQYCMKEPLSSLPRCRRNVKILFWLDKIVKYTILFIAVYWTFSLMESWNVSASLENYSKEF